MYSPHGWLGRYISYREVLYTALPPAEVRQRLQASLLPTDAPTWRDDYQPAEGQLFQGSVADEASELLHYRRVQGSRQAGPYPIQVQVHPHGSGSCLRFRFTMMSGGWALLGFQVALVSSLTLAASAAIWLHSGSFPWFAGWWLVLLLFWAGAGSYFSFYQEAVRVRPLLVSLLELYSPPPA